MEESEHKTSMDDPADGVPVVTPVESFDEFYARERRSVVGLAYALSGSSRGAEDLAQEAFLAAYRRWDRLQAYDDPGAWVRRVVANRSVSAYRRGIAEGKAMARMAWRRPLSQLDDLPPPSDEVWTAVRRLPKRQAQTVALHYLEDRSLEEIAEILKCSKSTANTHLRRGRERLAELLNLEDR